MTEPLSGRPPTADSIPSAIGTQPHGGRLPSRQRTDEDYSTVLLCAGPINYANLPTGTGLSSAMIPVNGKPVIAWVLDDLLAKDIVDVAIVLRAGDERLRNFLERAYRSRIKLRLVPVPGPGTIVESLRAGLEGGTGRNGVRVILGDTLIRDPFDSDRSFVYVGEVHESRRWCIVETDENDRITRYLDKVELPPNGAYQALAGYYHLTRSDLLRSAVDAAIEAGERELSQVLTSYGKEEPIEVRRATEWHDFGHIDNLVDARRSLLRPRHFNRLTIDPILNTITKGSDHNEKLQDELDWYLALPEDLKTLTPRIISHHRRNGQLEVVQEYYGYPTLAELFVYGDLGADTWISILRHVLDVHRRFRGFPGQLDETALRAVYVDKTFERLAMLREQDAWWAELLDLEEVRFNGRRLRNLPLLAGAMRTQAASLARTAAPCIIHGDLCFSNILFDVNNKIIRLIDPRGSFGRAGIYGDPRYDIAKLRHSVNGLYDYVVADMFTVHGGGGTYEGEVYADQNALDVGQRFDRLVAGEGYSVDEIRFVEGLLFLSMLPLHRGHPDRQKAMFLTSIALLNEVLP